VVGENADEIGRRVRETPRTIDRMAVVQSGWLSSQTANVTSHSLRNHDALIDFKHYSR